MKLKTQSVKRGMRKVVSLPQETIATTELKDTEEALRKSEERYRSILENIDDGYFEADLAGNFTFFNDAICRIWGYPKDELMGMNNRQYMDKETAAKLYVAHNLVYKTGKPGSQFDYEIIRKDKTRRIVQSSFSRLQDKENRPIGFRGTIRDVTDRRIAEEALCKSEENYRQAFSSTSDIIIILDDEMKISSITPSVERILGYKPEEMIQHRIDQLNIMTPASLEQSTTNALRVLSGESVSNTVYEFIARDGSIKFGELTASPIQKNGEIVGMIAIARDITERKRAEDALRLNEYFLRKSQEVAQLGSYDLDTKTGRWVSSSILDHIFGIGGNYSKDIPGWLAIIHPEDREDMRQYLTEHVVKGKNAFEKEYRIIRLNDGQVRWVFGLGELTFDEDGGTARMIGTIQDITPKKNLEQDRQDSINSLRKSLSATINAMSATVEARDPYTAGHQRRVADLARAIATEMQLSRDRIDGIRLAGMIHDLGKISVPSEILTKPTRLSNLEVELIRTHPEAGYNILKDIEFPWPIARIVLEHHERVNGSGYPNGLRGEDILLESKIISIADVVEAIASHRPYRPALGINPALDEIAKNSGILYDAGAAEACLKLFRENRYRMPD